MPSRTGRDELRIGDGLCIGIYSLQRTLVDAIRLRHQEGADVAWEALRRWIARNVNCDGFSD
ncbi:hypothetical protein [Peristeroidobacter agariperforans]|uniref:hypothetical protein n=1 Tax=Peristeroidobacter agariperforans TaxID=268404 RepID=UPI00101D7825|nr:hypothetical protein [Peristeroidobacter agariperforans]